MTEQSRSFVLDRSGLHAALVERYGVDVTPARLAPSRCQQVEAALDIARDSGVLARPKNVDVHAYPIVGGDGVIVTVSDGGESSTALAAPWHSVAEDPSFATGPGALEVLYEALDLVLAHAEHLIAELRILQDERARRCAGVDAVPWAIARCLQDRGHDLAQVSAALAADPDDWWTALIGPAVDAVEDRVVGDAAH